MTISLMRVDDRLIHGQVVIGWGARLDPVGYLVVGDEIAASSWEQELYRMGLPDGARSEFVAVEDAPAAIQTAGRESGGWIVLFPSIEVACRVARTGALRGAALNLGGIHAGEGGRILLPYLQLAAGDVERLVEMRALGVEISARDLPDSADVPLDDLLR